MILEAKNGPPRKAIRGAKRGPRKAAATEARERQEGHLKVAATVELFALALAEGFVEKDGGSGGGV
jgi:hypothetical protein